MTRTRFTIAFSLILTISILFGSCRDKNIPFNKIGWNESGDGIPCPPLREKMLNDLLHNHKLKGLTYRALVDKLGEPTIFEMGDTNTVSYELVVEYGFDIDPKYIKTLDFYYNKDSIITNWEIKEYKH
jgi:hypothetical protein